MSIRYLLAVALIIACTRLVTVSDEPVQPVRSLTSPATADAGMTTMAWPLAIETDAVSGQDPGQRLYDRIVREMLRGDCEAAVHGYRLFLELYGMSPRAPVAEFWQGECEFRLGRYADAIVTFDRVLNRDALPAKVVSAALMRKGLSYARLGETGRSRHTLELVVSEFPESSAADTARRQLVAVLPR